MSPTSSPAFEPTASASEHDAGAAVSAADGRPEMTWLDVAAAVWDAFYGLMSTCEELVEHLPTSLQCLFDWC